MDDWSFEGILDDLGTDLTDIFWGILADMVDIGADLLESVPVPEFMGQMPTHLGSVPSTVIYFTQPFEITYGLSVISAALASRLLLSLLPIVGGAFR